MKVLTVGDLYNDKRPLLRVIREDNGQEILVHPALVEFVSADRVKILIGKASGKYGRVVPMEPEAN